MGNVRWIGNAVAVAQVNTITPANVGIGNTFSVTINGKTITFTATAATVANVCAGLQALLDASTIPEFAEITWTTNNSIITGTSDTAGVPFVQTSSASGGTATLVTATATACSGPNFWSVAKNWDSGAVPVDTDDVFIDNTAVPILYGLDQSAVTLASLTIRNTKQGFFIGLPEVNASGGYHEYRETYLAIGATACTIDDSASGRIKINFGSVQTTALVARTGSQADIGIAAVVLKGTNSSNALEVQGGTVDLAPFGGEAATLAALRISGGTVYCSTGVTLSSGTINQSDGSLEVWSAISAWNISGGSGYFFGGGAITTLNVYADATFYYASSGTATTVNVYGIVDANVDISARTFTTTTLYKGGTIRDRHRTITFTNKVAWGSDVTELTAA